MGCASSISLYTHTVNTFYHYYDDLALKQQCMLSTDEYTSV